MYTYVTFFVVFVQFLRHMPCTFLILNPCPPCRTCGSCSESPKGTGGIPVLKGVGSIYEASMVLNPNKMIFQN